MNLMLSPEPTIAHKDRISRMQYTRVPDLEIVVPLVLGCTSLCSFLCLFVGEVQSLLQFPNILSLIWCRQSIRRQPQKSISCKSRMSPKHQEIMGISSRVMEGSIICMHQRCNMRLPITLLVILQCPQNLQKGLVKALTLAISHCVVGCCPLLLCPCDTTQLLDKV